MTREQANFEEHRLGAAEFQFPDAPDPIDIFRQATQFVAGILEDWRTDRAVMVRLAAARYLLFRKESASRVARRLKVSKRHFYRTVPELRRDCGIG